MKQLFRSALALTALVGVAAGISYGRGASLHPPCSTTARTMTSIGTVVELRWVNPHVSLSVDGKLKDSRGIRRLGDGDDEPRQSGARRRLVA
jgi:hypothetical protein